MATLDDTCVIHRAGYARAREIKDDAKALTGHFDMDKLKAMCDRYASEGISPGGAADMLALTIFMDSILN
jgi:triphosphoribosyl-dephospho-CoA synthase